MADSQSHLSARDAAEPGATRSGPKQVIGGRSLGARAGYPVGVKQVEQSPPHGHAGGVVPLDALFDSATTENINDSPASSAGSAL